MGLRRRTLRTKLRLLVAMALAGTLALGVPTLLDHLDSWHAASRGPELARAASRLSELLRRVEGEATLSARLLASGDPAARRSLATARPLTDRAGRAIAGDSARLAADQYGAERYRGLRRALSDVQQEWGALRRERITVDRRTVGDVALLERFDAHEQSIVQALDATAAAASGSLAADLRAKAAVARAETTAAQEQATLLTALERGRLDPSLTDRLVFAAAVQQDAKTAAANAARSRSATLDLATVELRSAGAAVAGLRAPALAGNTPFLAPSVWLRASERQLDVLRTMGRVLDPIAINRATATHEAARDRLVRSAGLIAGLLFLEFLIGLLVIRAITRPIRDVTRAATTLARRQQEHPLGGTGGELVVQPLAARTRDDVGNLARAVHDIDVATADGLETQRQNLRHDIGDVYVNLARRNQPLLRRQLELIDTLEAGEHDPDRLSALFLLDHLATRLRRNAESLLVLAGVDDQRTHPDSAPLLEVVRGAASEIAAFERVDIVGLPPDTDIVGRFAVDLTHVLAELLENATRFSPPETRIFVGARRRPNGLELTIADEGIGIPVDRLDALNELLAHPPLPGFDLSRSLGLVVVARLCERIGAEVRLRSAAEIGTSAVVMVPLSILQTADHDPALITRGDAWVDADAPHHTKPATENSEDPEDVPTLETPATADPTEQLPRPATAPVSLVLPETVATGASAEDVPDTIPDDVGFDSPRTVERFSPVPTERTQDLLPLSGRHTRSRRRRNGREAAVSVPTSKPRPVVTPSTAALPRRTPVTPIALTTTAPLAPTPRAPNAVFELVARYEAGRRRAATDQQDPDHEQPDHEATGHADREEGLT